MDAAQFAKIREGMLNGVQSATGIGKRAASTYFPVAGKTSTAQFIRKGVRDNITSFLAYAPADAPQYAVVVVVSGGSAGGSVCAPIAKRILEDVFLVQQGKKEMPVVATEPVAGHFELVNLVNY